jgi:small-conductance mechanosensitive channel
VTKRWLAAIGFALVGAAWPASAENAPAVSEGKVETRLDRRTDQQVEERLRATFGALEQLAGVSVEVEAGVVGLSGTVDSTRARTLAAELAGQVEGVTAVENDIEETRSVERRLGIALERLRERAWDLIDRLPLLLLALTMILLAMLLARVTVAWDLPFRLLTPNVFLRDLARQAVRVTLVVIGALLALEIMDATALLGAVLGAAGLVGLAVGFAFRDLVENYIASILLSVRQPFAPNDLVVIQDIEGRVARLTSRATILVTHEGNHVRIPNSVVFKATIVNLTKQPERRFSFGVGVGVDEDLLVAEDLGTGILRGMDGVIDEPPPFCHVEELGDSSVTLRFFAWVDQSTTDFGKARSEAIRLVKQAFDQAEVEMPEPIQRFRVEPVPERTPRTVSAPPESAEVRDLSPDRHVEAMVEEERAGAEVDLLSETGDTE